MSGGIVKSKEISEVTERRMEENVKRQSERRRNIVSNAPEYMRDLYSQGCAKVDYHNGKLVRL